jgi:hypothetical protein
MVCLKRYDTVYIPFQDTEYSYETGVCHPDYDGGDWVIVDARIPQGVVSRVRIFPPICHDRLWLFRGCRRPQPAALSRRIIW